ncbi:hypothetical protein AURDEDRAFT_164304 [Auricularia subglabra TFB-10046 SS5]|nr:hypothetical protein AURDEDRAFT_164304 [Auricularia subglabra TFB-10046 SS5]
MDSLVDIIDGAGSLDIGSFDLSDVLGGATGIFRALSAFDRIISLSPASLSRSATRGAASQDRQSPRLATPARPKERHSQPPLVAPPTQGIGSVDRLHSLSGVYAVLHSSAFGSLGDDAKIAVGGVSRTLKMSSDPQSWMELLNALMTCPVISPLPECDIDHAQAHKIQQPNWLKSGAQDAAVIEGVQAWLCDLLKGPGTLSLSKTDIASIIDYARATVSGVALHKGEHKYRKLLDVGMFCYPDASSGPACFKFYHIELYAWYQRPSNEGTSHLEGGSEGCFTARFFEPRQAVISNLTDAIRKKALAAAEVLFAS